MSQRQHLRRRSSGIYSVRLVVPLRLRAAVGQSELQRSTGCRDLALAKVVATEMAARWHATMARLRHMDLQKIKAGSIDLIGDGSIALIDAAATLGASPADLADRLARRHARFFVQAVSWDGWVLDDIWALDREHDEAGNVTAIDITETALDRLGQRRQRSGQLQLFLAEEAVEIARSSAGQAVCLFVVPPSRHIGFVVPVPGRHMSAADILVLRRDVENLRTTLLESLPPELAASPAPAPEPPPQPQQQQQVHHQDSIAKAKYGTRPVSELTTAYLAAKRIDWSDDEARRQEASCSALVELSGDPALHEIDREALLAVAHKLMLVPERRHRCRDAGGARITSWNALIEHADANELPRLSPNAVERIVDDAGAVFKWGLVKGWLRENPAVSLGNDVFKQMGGLRTAAETRRDRFSEPEIARIFSVEWFARGVGDKTARGIYFGYRPHKYWLPLLGLLVGGRINELSQLYLGDIKLIYDGEACWIIDFNLEQPDKVDADDDDMATLAEATDPARTTTASAADKSLKTTSSKRQVPLHSKLIELGLLEYVEALRSAGYERLFPELSFNAVKGYGKQAGSWFNDRFLGRRMKIERNSRKTFHSLRHNFITALERAGVPDKAVKQLIGHSLSSDRNAGATPGYQKRREILELRPFVEQLAPSLPAIAKFNVDEGLVAIRDALRLKDSHRERSSS